jgi:hypothetical protein
LPRSEICLLGGRGTESLRYARKTSLTILHYGRIGPGGHGRCPACSRKAEKRAYSYETAPCPNPNIPEIGPAVNLGPEFTCGYLTVPENRDKPDGRKTRVAVAHAKAASATPKPDPIIFLTHGPGGIAFLDAVSQVAAGMNADRDVYFAAQLGNYHSEPQLTCPDYDTFTDQTAISLKFVAPSTGAQDPEAVKASP